MSLHTDLNAALDAAVPEGVCVALEDPQAEPLGLYPVEHQHVARALDKRRREFAAGRRAARAALACLGQGSVALPARPSRAPVWPPGYVGSISHCADLCLALAARKGALRSLGCDVELRSPLSAPVVAAITSAAERDWLDAQSQFEPVHLFSAKEAVYKALFVLTGKVIGFHDLQIMPDSNGALVAHLTEAQPGFARATALPLLSLSFPDHVIHMSFIH